MNEINSFRQGIKDGIPVCLGYLSVSFAFGIFATESGLSVLQTLLVSMMNVTSAGQLAGVPIIMACGGYIELAVSQLVINLRYALMSVSLSQKLGKSMRLSDRFLVSFVNTDEVFAIASGKKNAVGRKYLYGLILTPYLGWSLGTLLGALAGNILPKSIVSALGIAIYGMFVAIVIPEAKKSRATALCAVFAVMISCMLNYVPLLSRIPSGFSIIICAVLSSALFAFFAPLKEEVAENE